MPYDHQGEQESQHQNKLRLLKSQKCIQNCHICFFFLCIFPAKYHRCCKIREEKKIRNQCFRQQVQNSCSPQWSHLMCNHGTHHIVIVRCIEVYSCLKHTMSHPRTNVHTRSKRMRTSKRKKQLCHLVLQTCSTSQYLLWEAIRLP